MLEAVTGSGSEARRLEASHFPKIALISMGQGRAGQTSASDRRPPSVPPQGVWALLTG